MKPNADNDNDSVNVGQKVWPAISKKELNDLNHSKRIVDENSL